MPHLTRRNLLLSGAALAIAPTTATAEDMLTYVPGLDLQHLARGETVLLDFAADWCSTCRRQARIVSDLRAQNPSFNQNITFIRIDWDQYGQGERAFELNIPRRSTLVLLRGEAELGRLVASTRVAEIEALLTLGLA